MELRDLSDRELIDHIRTIDHDITRSFAQIEPAAARRKRTIKIARATFLTAGGLFATSFDLLGIALTLFGLWDRAEVLVDDAAEMNRQIALHRTVKELGRMLEEAEQELEQRSSRLP